jgi:hypothetical protein
MIMDRGTLPGVPAHDHDLKLTVFIDQVTGISSLGEKSVRSSLFGRYHKPVENILHSRRSNHGAVALQDVYELGERNVAAHLQTFFFQ